MNGPANLFQAPLTPPRTRCLLGDHREEAGEERARSKRPHGYTWYDAFDNVTKIDNDSFDRTMTVDQGTNRVNYISERQVDGDWVYDGAGNLTSCLGGSFVQEWDALNMPTRATDTIGEAGDYVSVYGPGDYRVWVEDLDTGTRYWTSRDPNGRILREHEIAPGEAWTHIRDYLYGAEGLLATRHRNGTQRFFHADHLGTPRLLTSASGGVLSELHYYPFGLQANPPPEDLILADGFESGDFTGWNEDHDELSYKFTGHQRDQNRLTDYMLGRSYIFLVNRFASVDPARDGWNLYAYARNNPVGNIDPDGREEVSAIERGAQGAAVSGGAALANDASVRTDYINRVQSLDPGDSAGRTNAKMAARSRLSAIGKALSEFLRPEAGESQRAGGTANRTNPSMNRAAQGGRAAGRTLLVVGVGMSVANVATAPEGQVGETAVIEGGALAGALVLGGAGGKGGGVVGVAVGGPAGGVIGAILGGLGGGSLGGILGEDAAQTLVDSFSEDEPEMTSATSGR